MAAVLAFAAFVVALILHIAGGSAQQYVIDAELVGLAFLALALIVPGWQWPRRGGGA